MDRERNIPDMVYILCLKINILHKESKAMLLQRIFFAKKEMIVIQRKSMECDFVAVEKGDFN